MAKLKKFLLLGTSLFLIDNLFADCSDVNNLTEGGVYACIEVPVSECSSMNLLGQEVGSDIQITKTRDNTKWEVSNWANGKSNSGGVNCTTTNSQAIKISLFSATVDLRQNLNSLEGIYLDADSAGREVEHDICDTKDFQNCGKGNFTTYPLNNFWNNKFVQFKTVADWSNHPTVATVINLFLNTSID